MVFVSTASVPGQETKSRFVRGEINGRDVNGVQLIRAINRSIVLGNDGWLHDFDPRETPADLQSSDTPFQPLQIMEMRQQLLREFGPNFQVTTTNHFIVVHPKNSTRAWANIFEQLHRTFVSYFEVRRVRVRQGNFPMVAIVFAREQEMARYLNKLNIKADNVLGVYDRASNRIVMYDHGDSSGGISSTICHEAAHQSAFNSGIHSRLAATPHWIVEGVGCLFQSPAMVQGKRQGPVEQRIDRQLLFQFQNTYATTNALANAIEDLVRSDQMFRQPQNVANAYALSWAITFYISERRTASFSELMRCYADLPTLESYPHDKRSEDFIRIIGSDYQILARQMLDYYKQL